LAHAVERLPQQVLRLELERRHLRVVHQLPGGESSLVVLAPVERRVGGLEPLAVGGPAGGVPRLEGGGGRGPLLGRRRRRGRCLLRLRRQVEPEVLLRGGLRRRRRGRGGGRGGRARRGGRGGWRGGTGRRGAGLGRGGLA